MPLALETRGAPGKRMNQNTGLLPLVQLSLITVNYDYKYTDGLAQCQIFMWQQYFYYSYSLKSMIFIKTYTAERSSSSNLIHVLNFVFIYFFFFMYRVKLRTLPTACKMFQWCLLNNRVSITFLFLSSPVQTQPSVGHLMAKERIFLCVALSGKTSY